MGSSVSPLPVNFQVGSYQITAVLDSDEWSILYQATGANGEQVKIREFCPEIYATRINEEGGVKFKAENIDALHQAKEQYDQLYGAGTSARFSASGTEYFVYHDTPAPQGIGIATRKRNPASAPVLKSPALQGKIGAGKPIVIRQKTSSGAKFIPFVVIGFLAIMGFLVYQVFKTPPPIPQVAEVVAPKPVKPAPKPVIVKEPEPEPEPMPEPEPEIVQEEPEPEPEPEPVEPTYDPTKKLLDMKRDIRADFAKNTGRITGQMIEKYADYAEASIREYVTLRKARFSPEFEEWIKKTQLHKDVFATFYPPDPNVATNVDILVRELGERAYTYPQLVLAFAIGRREFGLGSFDLGHQGRYGDVIGTLEGMKGEGIWEEPAELFVKNMPPINYYGASPGRMLDEQYEVIHKYLSSRKLTPKQAWVNKDRTINDLKSQGVSADNLAQLLHEELFRTNQLKRKRDPFPTSVEFFNFLVDKYEQMGSMKDVDGKKVEWNGIPIDCAPWPLMLPLSETRPIRESESVWDRYLGKKKGPRIWRYGPYRMDKDPQPPVLFSMDPDPEWSPTSYDRHLYVGGVCGTMSLIARNSQNAMGYPAAPAGQPGHGNLISFRYDGGVAFMTVDQSIAPLKETSSWWYLRDAKTPRCGAGEYMAGIRDSVNLSLKEQSDSRIGMNILKLNEEEGEVATKLKENALDFVVKTNPFYTEAWYMLFDMKGNNIEAAVELTDQIRKNTNTPSKLFSKKPYHRSMGRMPKDFKKSIENNVREYTSALVAALFELAMKDKNLPDFKKSEWEKLLHWTKREAKENSYPEINELEQIALAMSKGPDSLVQGVTNDFKKIVNFYSSKSKRKKELKVDPDLLVHEINAAVMVMKEKDKLPWLADMVEKAPLDVKFRFKDNNALLTDFYKCVTGHYITAAKNASKHDDVQKLEAEIEKGKKEFLEKEAESEKK